MAPGSALPSPQLLDNLIGGFLPHRLLLKVANRCNINCSYCYWFHDQRVYTKEKILTPDAERLLYARLDEYFSAHKPERFSINFHGGEPLLLGKKRFSRLCAYLRQLEQIHSVDLRLSVQTNGLLIDDEWAKILKGFRVTVGVSLDGTMQRNDLHRLDFSGRSTYIQVVRGIRVLQDNDLAVGILSVWSPGASAIDLCKHFAHELGIFSVDFLMPDGTFDDRIDCTGMSDFFCALFDIWYFEEIDQRFEVRVAKNLLRLVLTGESDSESLGYGPTTTFAVGTEGDYEVLDVLNVLGSGAALTRANLRDTPFDRVNGIPEWRRQVISSLLLNRKCVDCHLVSECGGGYLPSRYSSKRGFNNPSRNCSELTEIITHVRKTVALDLENLRLMQISYKDIK